MWSVIKQNRPTEGVLGLVESQDGTISSSTLATVDGESNGVVESETKSRVSLFTTFSAVEKLCLEKVVNNREQSCKVNPLDGLRLPDIPWFEHTTASCISGDLASWALDTGGCSRSHSSERKECGEASEGHREKEDVVAVC